MYPIGWRRVQGSVFLLLLAYCLIASVGCTSPVTVTETVNPVSQVSDTADAKDEKALQEENSLQDSAREDLALGISHLQVKEYDLAIENFCLVLAQDQSKQSEDDNGDLDESGDTTISPQEELSSLKEDALYYRGLAFLEKGFANTAVEDFNEVLKIDRLDARTYEQRGRAHAELSQWYEAVRDCTRAIRLNPRSGMAYYYRGWSYLNWDKSKLAVADLREAVRLQPDYANEARQHIGRAYQTWYDELHDAGNSQQAEEVQVKANEVLTAMMELAASTSGDTVSRYFVAKAITTEPSTEKLADSHYQKGMGFLENGELVEAISEFNRAIELEPDFADAYFNSGVAQLRRGFPNTAIGYFNKTLNKGLRTSELYCLLAQAHSELGELHLVPRYATQAIMLDSSNANAYRIRAVSYLSSSHLDLAKRDFEEAVRLAPEMKDEIKLMMRRVTDWPVQE